MNLARQPLPSPAAIPGAPAADPAQRAAELLSLGRRLLDELDRGLGDPIAGSQPLADSASADAGELQQVNLKLLPLMQRLRRKPEQSAWWRWFTGERLEQQILFERLQQEIEQLATHGEQMHVRLQRHAQALKLERLRMGGEVQRLANDAAALQLLLGKPYAAACREAGLREEDLARLSRRAANLETMASATQLSRGQYKVTITHLHAVADRFVELRALLLPLWKQAMGFELFAQRVQPDADR